MIRKFAAAVAACALVASTGCTHALRVTDSPEPAAAWRDVPAPLRLGFSSTDDVMLQSAIDEIAVDSRVTAASRDFALGDAEVDYVIMLRSSRVTDAAPQNFWITFPGFLLFTHAWMGYKYSVNVQTTSVVMDGRGEKLSETVFEAPYDIRHTSFPRGAAAGLTGWLTPGYGVLAVIPGAISANSYDTRADEDFAFRALPSFRTAVASRVFEQLAEIQRQEAATLTP